MPLAPHEICYFVNEGVARPGTRCSSVVAAPEGQFSAEESNGC
jgi:hypothetical protein